MVAATLFAIVLASKTAHAQAQSDALLDRFQPPPPGEYFAGLPFPRYNGDYYVVMRAGATLRITGAHSAATAPPNASIGTQLMLHPLIFFGVHNSVGVYAGLPVQLQNFGGAQVERHGRAGDPRIGARVRILNEAARSPWSIHLAGEFFLPAFWLNGIAPEHFTGASDGTVRGNIGLIGAGSVGFDTLPPAVGNRFLWSVIAEENIRPSATDVRPGPETHVGGGVGFLFPNDGHGGRITLEGHSWWRWDRITQGWPGVTLEAVLGGAIRLPAEFEITASFSMGSAWQGDVVVRDALVWGGTIGVAYAIRDWAGFPLAYDNAGNVPAPRPRVNDAFGFETRWDRDGDGLDDREDPCPTSAIGDPHRTASVCDDAHARAELEARTRRGNGTMPVSGLRLPVALERPLVAEAPADMHGDLVFHSAADLGRLARTVDEQTEILRQLRLDFLGSILTGIPSPALAMSPFDPSVLTVYASVDLQFAERLHPALRASGALRRAWILLQFERALHAAGAVFHHVDMLEPSPCRDDEPVDRVCLYASVRLEPVERSEEFQHEIDQLEEQGMR